MVYFFAQKKSGSFEAREPKSISLHKGLGGVSRPAPTSVVMVLTAEGLGLC